MVLHKEEIILLSALEQVKNAGFDFIIIFFSFQKKEAYLFNSFSN